MSEINQDAGVAVVYCGEIVAWFKEFDEDAQEWCSSTFYRRWRTFAAKAPEIIPFTEEEIREAERKGKEYEEFFLGGSDEN